MTIEQAMELIHGVAWRGSRPGLARVRELLHRLGLSAPETVELCWQLRKAGQELPLDTLTIEECAQALRRWASA